MSCHHVETWLRWFQTYHREIVVVQETVWEYWIEIERISRDEMHAQIFASPSSAEELRNHLTELSAFRSLESEETDH